MLRDRQARTSLLGTSLFWGSGSTLRLVLFAWVPFALGLADTSSATNLGGVVSIGIIVGAGLAGAFIRLEHAPRALWAGLLIGAPLLFMGLATELWHAGALLIGLGAADWDLRPAMSLRSQIIAVRDLQAGESVGYGALFTATQPMRVGIVACGYADGYPRTCPTGTPVLVGGQRSRTLGRVSMDMLCVDLAWADSDVGVGSEVTLWGSASTGQVLPIDEVAASAGTLGYELMCALAQRVLSLLEARKDVVIAADGKGITYSEKK